ncbi:MAG: hypothetical protein GVY23_01215 [Spirochaetes bacterium]|jgi:hypothetical protein|nr:hypothetical protein [Spirochaetota bacterium]
MLRCRGLQILLVVVTVVTLVGCSAFSKELVSGDAPATISLQDVPDGVDEIRLIIDGPDMDPIERTISRATSSVAILVPVGSERTFTAQALGYFARRTIGVPPEGLMVSLRLSARPVATFTVDAEGWTTFGVARNFEWKPGGFIYAEDNGGGTYFYFSAGPGFLGDLSDRYGATFSYDLRTNLTGADGFTDIVVEGADFRIVYDFGAELPVVDTWTSFSATVAAGAGWLRQEIGDGSPTDVQTIPESSATEQEIRAVLSDVRAVNIRGEYSAGADITRLDNVRW